MKQVDGVSLYLQSCYASLYLHEVFTLAGIDLLDFWFFVWLADRMLFGSLCSLSEQ